MSKKIEIDETDFLNYQSVANAVQTILKNPEAADLLVQAKRKAMPDAPLGDYERQQAPIAAVSKQVAELQKQLADERAERERQARVNEFSAGWERAKGKLRQSGYTDAGIDEIEKLAQERGIANLEDAAAVFDKLHPPQEPASPTGFGTWNFFEPGEDGKPQDNYIKALFDSRGEDENAVLRESHKVLQELRGQPRR